MNLKHQIEKIRNDNYQLFLKERGYDLPFAVEPEKFLSAIHSAITVAAINQVEHNTLSKEEYECLELLHIWIDSMVIDTNRKIDSYLESTNVKVVSRFGMRERSKYRKH